MHGGFDRAVDEPYVIDTYGDLTTKLWAAEALADAVAVEQQRIHDNAWDVTAEERGAHEVRVAAAKAAATDVALEITTRIFEVTGARSTSSKVGLDLFFRNVRTHTLHDPVAYKRREVGRHQLIGELPEPTWYS
ncbi:MAG: acyl-CoA dehydrogenase family protein [Corynebacteriales bacterium]|nr:acyl-CoA dehydrogenase family protein [Mycobacteriales bacterium]